MSKKKKNAASTFYTWISIKLAMVIHLNVAVISQNKKQVTIRLLFATVYTWWKGSTWRVTIVKVNLWNKATSNKYSKKHGNKIDKCKTKC